MVKIPVIWSIFWGNSSLIGCETDWINTHIWKLSSKSFREGLGIHHWPHMTNIPFPLLSMIALASPHRWNFGYMVKIDHISKISALAIWSFRKICLKSPCTASTALLALIEVQGLLRQSLYMVNFSWSQRGPYIRDALYCLPLPSSQRPLPCHSSRSTMDTASWKLHICCLEE